MSYLLGMQLNFFHAFLFTQIITCSIACSGPQMISNPPPAEVERTQKKDGSTAQSEIKMDPSEEQGVFDDEKFQLKANLKTWKLIDDEGGIQTYEKAKSNSGLVAFRGEILIPAPLKKVASVLINESLQKDWIDSFVETKRISTISELEHIQYNQTKVPWPFQNRDFVFRVQAKIHPNPATVLIAMKSVDNPNVPLVSGITRGEIIHSYYYLKEKTGFRATKMVVEMEVDPKGAIPLWLVNLSQKGWPHNTLAAVKKLSLRDDIPISPEIDKYFSASKKITKEKKK